MSSSDLSSLSKEDRGIAVREMRNQAVNRNIGRWAVEVGISDYQYDSEWDRQRGLPDLSYAHRDAQAFAKFLLSPQGGAFAPDRVLLLTNEQATVKAVRKGIGDFLAQSLEDDLAFIFFAGHDLPDPKRPKNLYLACHDTEPGNFYGTALPLWEIDLALEKTILSKKVFVLADACHSAGVGGTRGGDPARRFNDYMNQLASSKQGVTKITASRANELSQERQFPKGGHGVFTYFLLQGLKGQADRDADGFVTMQETYDYLYDRVRSETRQSQHPWASAYVSSDIPVGITDAQVLEAIKTRIEETEPASSPGFQVASVSPEEIPQDSEIALKLTRAKLAKGEVRRALGMVETILDRKDEAKPQALALKIEILLQQDKLRQAEDAEDLLVIPYPEHPAARKGSKLIYEYYLAKLPESPKDQIKHLQNYLKRHPNGLFQNQALAKKEQIETSVRSRYERTFQEHLTLAEGFLERKRFERTRNELDQALETAQEARSAFGIGLNVSLVEKLRLRTEEAEHRAAADQAYAQTKSQANNQLPLEQIQTWQQFVQNYPGNPHLPEAKNTLETLRHQAAIRLQTRFDDLLAAAESALKRKEFARSLEKLDQAEDILHTASDQADVTLNSRNLVQLRNDHAQSARQHQEYRAWHQTDSQARTIALDTTKAYELCIPRKVASQSTR